MTRQTTAPLSQLSLNATNRQARELVNMVTDGLMGLNPPYQRGDVWSQDQRIALLRSMLLGIPIAAIIVNDRWSSWWEDPGYRDTDGPAYAVVDGKQRLQTMCMWFASELAIPASWWPAEDVVVGDMTDDGVYVRYSGLSPSAQRGASFHFLMPMVEAKLPSIEAEAEVYGLVNGAGTPQTDADMARAARIATGGDQLRRRTR